jgi:hypothetical protein
MRHCFKRRVRINAVRVFFYPVAVERTVAVSNRGLSGPLSRPGVLRDGGSVTGTRCASRRARHNWFYFGKVRTPSIMICIAAGVFSLGTDLAKMCAMPAIRSIAAAAAVMTHQPPPSLLQKRVSQTHSIQARCFKHQHQVARQQAREIRWIVRVLNPAPHTACVACAGLQTQGTR